MVLISLILTRTQENRRLFILWMDLRTAFPSLNRALLIHRMFSCGINLALCKLFLAIFDATEAFVCTGKWISRPFNETRGVREGAVESPHAFNMYIGVLRDKLQAAHPRLCKMAHLIIAVLLYADDAALPADTEEDLQLSASIFEDFCNEHEL